jgi:NAD(P)H-dependent FMN reductase
MSLNITLLYGSYRENRLGLRAVKYVTKQLEEKGHKVTFVDAMAYDLPMLDKRYVDYAAHEIPEKLKVLKDLFENKTDAFIVVAGEYNSTMQPGLMNLMDYFYNEFFHRPCGAITYSAGALGGARVSMHLLTVLNVFGMTPVPGPLAIGKLQEVLDEKGEVAQEPLVQQTKKFISHLEWYGNAFKAARSKGLPS